MNYHHIPFHIRVLSSFSVTSILWVCLLGLNIKDAINEKLNFSILLDFQFDTGFEQHLVLLRSIGEKTYTYESFLGLFISVISTFLLIFLLKREMTRKLNVSEGRRVKVLRLDPHENELLLKTSALLTIITVLYTASAGLAVLSTFCISLISPIWSYNSLLGFGKIKFLKATVILDAELGIHDSLIVIASDHVVKGFTYRPRAPEKLTILLYNKISIIR